MLADVDAGAQEHGVERYMTRSAGPMKERGMPKVSLARMRNQKPAVGAVAQAREDEVDATFVFGRAIGEGITAII